MLAVDVLGYVFGDIARSSTFVGVYVFDREAPLAGVGLIAVSLGA